MVVRSTRDEQDIVARAVTTIMGVVIGLPFLFGFGNVLALALRLGVTVYVAPLVAPAVDLSVLGLLLGLRHLLLQGILPEQLRPIRRLLLFASVVTLALNVADPLLSGNFGRAAFDSVGPLLLIGWAEVGPGLLQAIRALSPAVSRIPATHDVDGHLAEVPTRLDQELIQLAREINDRHWSRYLRPASAETIRKELRVGSARARQLRAHIRAIPAASGPS